MDDAEPTDTQRTRPLVLASASPRRAQLLGLLGRPFEIRIADVDESQLGDEQPMTHVARLAGAKAAAIDSTGAEIVVGADTVVVLDGEILGKPKDADQAREMLARLSGRDHVVLTGVAVRHGDDVRSTVVSTTVTMRDIAREEIAAYVATGEPFDKAGGYGIQGLGGRFVERIDGNYQNVVGLPLTAVESLLSELSADASVPPWPGPSSQPPSS